MNVVFFGFKRAGLAHIDDQQAAALDGATVQSGDVLLNITGASIGRVTLAPHDMDGARVNQHVCIIRPSEAIDARFLNAFLSSPTSQDVIHGENYGVTRQALTKQQILDFEIPLPPLPEQKRIADKLEAVLGRVDACRARLDRVPALLKRFRQSVLAAATSGKLTEGHSKTVTLSDVLSEIRTGPFGSSLHKSDYVPNAIPIVNPMHIRDGRIYPTPEMSIDARTLERLSDFKLKKGEVIIGRRGEMGRCAVVTATEHGWLCGTGSMVLTPRPNVDSAYLQLFLSSPETVQILEGDSVGSTMVNLNQKILLNLEISIPPLPEQTEIVRRVEALFALADRIEARLAAAQKTVESLTPATLAKAFRGELVPQDPDDEPAAELLNRIRSADSNSSTGKSRARRARA